MLDFVESLMLYLKVLILFLFTYSVSACDFLSFLKCSKQLKKGQNLLRCSNAHNCTEALLSSLNPTEKVKSTMSPGSFCLNPYLSQENEEEQCEKYRESKKAMDKLLKMDYFYQYSNLVGKPKTCANTSLAMVHNFLKPNKKIIPDKITSDFGIKRAQRPSGMLQIAKSYGLHSKMTTQGEIKDIKFHLSEGRPVIVNGYFTSSGHLVVIVGYDPETDEYIVNDPSGKWNQKWKGGYPRHNSRNGHKVRYKAKNFEHAITTTEYGGKSKIWMNVSSTDPHYPIKAPSIFKLVDKKACEDLIKKNPFSLTLLGQKVEFPEFKEDEEGTNFFTYDPNKFGIY